ncbi:RidA family protein [Rhodococcus rhodochrous]|uniref:RidA family protein n=1 Tax=Rhodococcus rhodochrous TaxID=1829 RepID=UPI0006C83E78|nr:RidA family protein [Rhodococcus rhodochrous]
MSVVSTLNPSTLGPALFPYSQAAIGAGLVFLAGQVALDPDNQVVAPGDPYEQTKYTIGRIRTILADTGATLENIVSSTVFITSLDHLPAFNRAWEEEFGDHRAARATVVAGLLINGLVVEIQSIAVAS